MTDIVDIGLSVDSSSVDKGTRSLDKFGDQSKRTESATGRLNNSLNKGAIAFAALAAAAAVAAASFSVIKAKEFEKSISDLSAITGATGKDLEYLSAKSKEFGATTTLSASQAAEAFKLIASAKPDLLGNVEALAAVTRETITLAEAAGMELPAAANALGASLNQFSAGAEEAGRFINVLAAGAKFGSSEIEQTSQALRVAGTVASNAGLSFEETNAAIQAMAAVALKGSEAGTGLRGVLLKLSTQSRSEFNPEIVGFTKAMQNLAAANLTTTEKQKLFGQESITAANAIIKQAESLGELTDKLTGTNTAYDQASTRTDNLDGDMKAFNSAIEALGINIGSVFLPVLRELVQTATSAAQALNSIFEDADEDEAKMTALVDKYYLLVQAQSKYTEGSKEYEFITSQLGTVEKEINAMADAYVKADEASKKLKGGAGTTFGGDGQGVASGGISPEQESAQIALAQHNADRLALMDDYFSALNDRSEQQKMTEEERAIAAFDEELNRIEAHREWMLEQGYLDLEAEAEIKQAREDAEFMHMERLNQIREDATAQELYIQQKAAKLRQMIDKGQYGNALNMALDFAKKSGLLGKAQFDAIKKAQMAIAIVQGIGTVMAAMKHGAENGGGVYGAIAEGLIAASVVSAKIAEIQGASYGAGSTPSAPSGGNASIPTPNAPVAPEGAPNQFNPQAPQRDITVNIEPGIYTEQHMRKLAEDLREAYMNGAPRP